MNIKNRIEQIKASLPAHVELIAVSKTQPVERIREAMEAGQLAFGENKVQEMLPKQEVLPQAQWHMIGHLQTNKVKYIVPFIHLIHSVDSMKLLAEINKRAARINRVVPCLLQVHIAQEETKFGFSPDELRNILNGTEIHALQHVQIRGLMGMATFTPDQDQIRKEFKSLRKLFDMLKESSLPKQVSMNILSMGMSHDYRIAIEEGSTMIRIGTAIFGERTA
ncbi:MAG: YggS family pyridoxal phosphate-dependent enzyme [Cyclobacteriaceae bacterium]|nr:YggS family pyridoxal phosphate-dependent enzyme [Cyclobacteriaceae bacterium]